MRILFLSDAAAPHTRRWVNWFAQNGHSVELITFNRQILENYEIIPQLIEQKKVNSSFLGRIIKFPGIYFKIRKIIKEFKPDLIHAHSCGGYAWMAMLSGFKPYIVTPWGTDLLVDIDNSRLECFFTKKALSNARYVTSDANHFKEILLRLGVNKEALFFHSFGTDIEKFKRASPSSTTNSPAKKINIISTRTPNPIHDVQTLVEAAPNILASFPEVFFTIVGGGSDLESLKLLAKRLNIDKRIHFTDMVEEDEMIRHLENADIYVSTSKADAGLAASTAEAMALELPVIQTDNSDNREWVDEGDGGFLFNAGCSRDLARCVSKAISQKQNWPIYGTRNRAQIVERYNYNIEMRKIEAIYKEATSKKSYLSGSS